MEEFVQALVINDSGTARELLEEGVNVNSVDISGETPLFYVAYLGNLDMVKLLVEFKANVNISNHKGFTPLHEASCRGHSGVVEYLVGVGADIDVQDEDGWSPLCCAIRMDRIYTARLLLISGANINTQDDDGTTPIIWSSKTCNVKTTCLLLGFGADINIKDVFDKTPLDWVKDSLKEESLKEEYLKDPKKMKKYFKISKYLIRHQKLETLKEYLTLGVWINVSQSENFSISDLFNLLPKQFQDQANILVQIYNFRFAGMNNLPLELFHELLVNLWSLF